MEKAHSVKCCVQGQLWGVLRGIFPCYFIQCVSFSRKNDLYSQQMCTVPFCFIFILFDCISNISCLTTYFISFPNIHLWKWKRDSHIFWWRSGPWSTWSTLISLWLNDKTKQSWGRKQEIETSVPLYEFLMTPCCLQGLVMFVVLLSRVVFTKQRFKDSVTNKKWKKYWTYQFL